VIHVHNFPDVLVFSAIIQRVMGAKIVLDIHDPMPELFQSKYSLSPGHWFTRLLRLEERVSVRLVDAVIAANRRFADLVEERSCPASKVVVVMNAPDDLFADHSEEVERRDAGTFEVLYIGTVAPRYGLDVVVDAIARLDREGSVPDLSFAIVPKLSDEGEYLRKLVDRIHGLGLSHRFRLEEPRAHHEMPDRIRKASVAVYPPRPDVHMDIALSLKVPEVVAVGRPLVASRLSVLLEYFGEESLFLFRPGDPEDCASRLLEIYRDQAEARRRVLRAQEALQKFSWSNGRREYLRLLSQLVSDGPCS
jgi:glycosyltransferase involved in cell wall biosynthesis